MNRCVITGFGAVTPVGNNAGEFWENIKNGKSGIDFITTFDTTEYKAKVGAEVKNFAPEEYVSKKEVKRNDKFSLYAMAAAKQAFDMSGIDLKEEDPYRFEVLLGSGIGGLSTIEEQILRMGAKGPSRVSPLFVPMVISNMAAGNVSIMLGSRGRSMSLTTACATGTHAIGEAFRSIKHGYADFCIAGGTEAPITGIGVAGFANLSALTTCTSPERASIPFDLHRSGFVIGEGSGVLMLEELNHALKRNAKIYGEVVGYGATSDAYHMTAPSPSGEGAAKAMTMAMEEAGITPQDLSYINAHGTSTPLNDAGETAAIKLALGEYAYKVPVSSTKSMTGHLLGAAGAIEALVCAMALADGFIPPTIGYQDADPECDLDYVPNVGRKGTYKYALSNSLGFGGHNGVLCFKKWESEV